jgi:GrpB-like predicted nucleotidyltransferase (UPF0157 family)/ribosomal protein S18 acetylase RimI-like enzyme
VQLGLAADAALAFARPAQLKTWYVIQTWVSYRDQNVGNAVKTEFHYLLQYPEAVPTVARWWFEAWGPTSSCSTAEALANVLAAELHREELPVQIVAFEDGELVGVAVLKNHELKQQFPGLRYWLGNVFVRSESRGRGIGSALVKRAEGIAVAMGITTLHLATDRTDGGLYARLGYQIVERAQKNDLDIVVMARQLDEPVQVVPYDESWPARFNEERARLQALLKPWLVGAIEHIGSTAVPGLVAKPVIDIMVGVQSLERSREAIPLLVDSGYVYFEYRAHIMHWFCKPAPWRRTHHLHLVPFQSPLWVQRLAFRDRLRRDPDAAAKYSELKHRLAREHEFDREAYTDGKEPFVRRVVEETLGAATTWVR